MELLLDHGGRYKRHDNKGNTPLRRAITKNDAANAENNMAENKKDVAELLRQYGGHE